MAGLLALVLACQVLAATASDSCDGLGTSLLQTSMTLKRTRQPDKAEVSYHWPSGRGQMSHYSVSEYALPFELEESLAWSWHHPLGRFHTITYGTAIDDKLNIYLTAADGLRKFSPEGKLLWEHLRLPAEVPTAASLDHGAVYSSDTHGNVFALDMESGQPLWSNKISEEIGQDNGFVMVHAGVVVAAGDHGLPLAPNLDRANHRVRGLNATDGSPLWSFEPDAPVWNFLALFPNDGTFVFQDMSGRAYRCKLLDGKMLWKAGGVEGTWTDGSAALGPNGVVYTVSNQNPPSDKSVDSPGWLSAYRLADGDLVWRVSTPRPPNNAPAVGKLAQSDKLSVVIPLGQQTIQGAPTDVYSYDAETGHLQWVFNGPSQQGLFQAGDKEGILDRTLAGLRPLCLPNGWSAPAIDANGTVYVGNEEGPFFALRDLDGNGHVEGAREVSSFDTHAAFSGSASPSLAPGTIAVASCDTLFVFK